jgi:hypothetical protein
VKSAAIFLHLGATTRLAVQHYMDGVGIKDAFQKATVFKHLNYVSVGTLM